MDIIFQSYKPLFVILGVAIFCAVGCVVFVIAVFVFSDSDPEVCDCRDDVLSQLPVYPDATLIDETDETSLTTAGSFVKTYEMTADFEDVVAFFEQQGCTKSIINSPTGAFYCTKSGERLWYEVEISHEAENTSYTITFTWNCGCLD